MFHRKHIQLQERIQEAEDPGSKGGAHTQRTPVGFRGSGDQAGTASQEPACTVSLAPDHDSQSTFRDLQL